MLVDAVTGVILHRQTAPSCRGPAVATLVENLAVVQLWDSATSRCEQSSAVQCRAFAKHALPVILLLQVDVIGLLCLRSSACHHEIHPLPCHSPRFTVTSLEVYDASDREFSVLDALFNPNATKPQSSFDVPPLEVRRACCHGQLLPSSSALHHRTQLSALHVYTPRNTSAN
jgi:hypothetical protein